MTTSTATATPTAPLGARELDNLVRSHLPLVGHLVREMLVPRTRPRHREDLTSARLAALAGAAKNFDPTRGTPFGSFATARIRGALLDELRGLDWASRSVRPRARRIETATDNSPPPSAAPPPTPNSPKPSASPSPNSTPPPTMSTRRRPQPARLRRRHRRRPRPRPHPRPRRTHPAPRKNRLPPPSHRRPPRTPPHRRRRLLPRRTPHGRHRRRTRRHRNPRLPTPRRSPRPPPRRHQLPPRPRPVPTPNRTDGCVARRRNTYYTAIATRSTLPTRLTRTNPLRHPHHLGCLRCAVRRTRQDGGVAGFSQTETCCAAVAGERLAPAAPASRSAARPGGAIRSSRPARRSGTGSRRSSRPSDDRVVVRDQRSGRRVVLVEAEMVAHCERPDRLARRQPLQVGDHHLDHEAAARLQVRGDVAEAGDLLVLLVRFMIVLNTR